MPKIQSQRILNPWFYDLVLEEFKTELAEARRGLNNFKKERDPPEDNFALSYLGDQIEQGKKGLFELVKQEHELIERAKPVLIDTATLDSLINATPNSYDYIKNKQVPFDELFFEFLNPFPMNIPFNSEKKEAKGIHCFVLPPGFSRFKIGNFSDKTYGIHVYFQDKSNKITPLVLETDPATQNTFYCTFEGNTFWTDMGKKTCKYQSAESRKKLSRDRFNPLGFAKRFLFKGQRDLAQKFSLDEVENNHVFPQLANLFTNLINYINAHNVTFVERSRRLDIIQSNERKRKKKQISKPYYLITIEDKVIERTDSVPDEERKLKCRFYVRGHCRNLRDDSGKIYLTSWIPPHVKRPKNAPWKYHRYQALADKLTKEKKMLEEM